VLKLNNSGNFYIDSLQNVSTQSVLLGGTSSINNRKIGYLNIGTGLSLSSGTLNSVWTASGNDVYNNNSGNVGIGTTSPDSTLTVIGGLRINNGAAQNNYVWTSTGTQRRYVERCNGAGNMTLHRLVIGGAGSKQVQIQQPFLLHRRFTAHSTMTADTLYVQSMRAVLQGSSPSVTYKVWYNDIG
jgi:hypothetical protein